MRNTVPRTASVEVGVETAKSMARPMRDALTSMRPNSMPTRVLSVSPFWMISGIATRVCRSTTIVALGPTRRATIDLRPVRMSTPGLSTSLTLSFFHFALRSARACATPSTFITIASKTRVFPLGKRLEGGLVGRLGGRFGSGRRGALRGRRYGQHQDSEGDVSHQFAPAMIVPSLSLRWSSAAPSSAIS